MQSDLRRGALHAMAAVTAFALMGACIKAVAGSTPNAVVVFVRCAVGLIILYPWLIRKSGLGIRTQRLSGHLWRAGFGILAMYAFFYALGRLPMAEAMLLTYSTPLWIPFIAWAWIGERPPRIAYAASALGLVGIILIVRPGGHPVDTLAAAIGAASGLFAACAMVSIRRIADTEPPARIVFYFSLLGTTITGVPMLWAWQLPPPGALVLLVCAGLLATIGQMQLTRAYGCAPAALIGPFSYLIVPLSGLLGWLIWEESLDGIAVLGAAIVVVSCLLGSWQRRPAAAVT